MEDELYQTNAKIVSNKKISKDFFLLTFDNKKIAEYSKPGQFIMIKIDNEKTFLRRPFSICGTSNGRFDVLFKVVGKGTELLSGANRGDTFNIIGPLGNGYRLPVTGYRLPILVAGGTGIASILLLAQFLASNNSNFIVFLGAKNRKEIMLQKKLKQYGCRVIVSTEDGSSGKKGLITDVFSRYISRYTLHVTPSVYACGPKPMLKKISKICSKYSLKCFVSLEEKMACGIGACMGCSIKIKNQKSKIKNGFEYKSVCKDGPVFDANEIIWD